MSNVRSELSAAAELEARLMKLIAPLNRRMQRRALAMVRAGQLDDAALRSLEAAWARATRTPQFRAAVANAARRVASATARRMKGIDKGNRRLAVAVDAFPQGNLDRAARRFARAQARLITKVGRKQRQGIARIVTEAVRTGRAIKDVERDIAKQLGPRDSRSRRKIKGLARNEVLTLSSNIRNERYEHAGIEKAMWLSSRDGRVRSEHAANDGKVYDVSRGINGERPGGPVGCRCTEVPQLPASLRRRRARR